VGFLRGKKALIVGVASPRSIAAGVATAFEREGAELAFSYQNEKRQQRVEEFASSLGSNLIFPCDVANDTSITSLFAQLQQHWDHIDIIVHSIAFAPVDQLNGNYIDDVNREGFRIAHDISSYSFVALAKAARSMLRSGSTLITMSYLGAVRAVPHYNVMGVAKASLEANMRYMAADLGPAQIRVNALSPGPIMTPAAKGISGFSRMLNFGASSAPLRRNVTIEEVGNAAAFLCSDLASGISGEVLYVDGGYHVQAMDIPTEAE
jgi:enoyl-[acyl-carrier protein] reductase I